MSEASTQVRWTMRPHYEGLTAYLMILVAISLCLFSIAFYFANSIVIYAQKDKPDFIQVFFPTDGAYHEENSARSPLFGNPPNGVRISVPRMSVDHVRIDPGNEAGDVVITKVEVRHLIGKESYLPDDLVARSTPIQMIDKFVVTSAGLVIHSTGNDPAFELRLNSSSMLGQVATLFLISVLLSVAVFLGLKKLAGEEMRAERARVHLLAIPLLMSVGVAALFYPGFMSYDTLHALRSARNGVTDSMWPPMVSYVWRAVDLVSLNPSAMHFSQIFLLLFSSYFIVYFFTKKILYSAIFLLAYLSIPAVLGTVAVIWKDVLMAAFFLAGFAVILSMKLVTNRWRFIFSLLLATCLIFLGACSRHNAITGAIPLLFYLALVVCSRMLKAPFRLWLGVFLFGSVLTGSIFLAKSLLDNYSLPGFVRLNNSTSEFIESVRVLDIAGASLCVGQNLFGNAAPNLTFADIRSGYDPRHVNLSKGLLDKVGVNREIDQVWLNVAFRHPVCFLSNKFELTKYLIGADSGTPFLITAPSVDKNEYGYSLPDSSIRDSTVDYIVRASQLPFLKPWFLYLISICFFVYLVLTRALTASYLTIFSSAIFYFAGLVIFGNAADARLLFYTTTALSIFTFISMFELKKRRT